MTKERIRVLIADDDGNAINTLRNYLMLDRDQEFIVSSESSPNRVLAAIDKIKPHVVLLDNQFADEEVGIRDLLPRIAGQFPHVKVIVVTGHRGSDTDQIKEALAWNIAGFLDKQGLEPGDLRKKVRNAFETLRREDRNLD